VHFPHLCPEENTAPIIPRDPTVPSQPERVPISSHNALQAVTQELALSLQTLISATETMDHLANHSAIIEAAWSANYSLSAANTSLQGTCALLKKDIIPPNQKTWPETAAQMGVKPVQKQKCLPEECGLTAKSIGVTKSKKRMHPDPYGVPPKHAKPDAMSASANEHACEHVPGPASNVVSFPLAPTYPASNAVSFPLVPPYATMLPPAFPNAPPTFNFGSTSAVPLFPPMASMPAPGIPIPYM